MTALNDWVRRLQNVKLSDTLHELRPSDVLMFCHDADRGVTLDGKAYSPLMDSVREDLQARGFSCQVVALQWSRLTGDLAHGDPKAMNGSYLRATVKLKIGQALGRFRRHKEPLIEMFGSMLARVRPRCVISIGSSAEMAIACRRSGVRHAELLHGLGYSIIPWDWDIYPPESVPSDILTLDATSTETFAPLERKGVRIHQIPHPFLKRFLDDGRHGTLPAEWVAVAAPSASHLKRKVLVALNWGYAGDHGREVELAGLLDNGLFPDSLIPVIDETASTTQWLFRFHPVQLRRAGHYAELFEFMDNFCAKRTNADWRWASHVPLPTALQHASALVTMQSMSAYEAAAMGVPTLALCPSVREGGKYSQMFDDLVAAGYVTKSDWSQEAVRSWIGSCETLAPLPGWRGDENSWNRAVSTLLPKPGGTVDEP